MKASGFVLTSAICSLRLAQPATSSAAKRSKRAVSTGAGVWIAVLYSQAQHLTESMDTAVGIMPIQTHPVCIL
ncbi:uncharacterized protein PHACADRAFT_257421 [Phanerochaete carnosa HHB-10118-sp]|uniref:Secreted protein n=1 Tax=Phanerochaete carnosa (strain HHB-10118-sp) TaxID=650164 RepID=K5W463_PHACS|nr:uncharacterized protein PHACADRAFT_257421 [Phanerochaete carnosa HHB-10118-sp]EKM53920.1 hypothetical protein PHACADRAFT_257421 [Phanerochaete carnosa HHB-10118-sp]